MGTLMQASHQWATRPADERFTSLLDMQKHFDHQRRNSSAKVVATKSLECRPVQNDPKALVILGPNGQPVVPSNWAFGQLAGLGKSPRGYLAELPAPLAADCMNYGLKFRREIDDVGVLLTENTEHKLVEMRAATGPTYGRIWNSDITKSLVDNFGDGVTKGGWKVPGEFGKHVDVTKANTTLFAGDRDMFVFLADEEHRITVPNRREGRKGSLARGFFTWNSEVGKTVFGLGTFLFDYACCNRIVWGAEGYKEIRIRHTSGAPDKWIDEVKPALLTYAKSSAKGIEDTIKAAQAKSVADKLDAFLAERFGRNKVEAIKSVHQLEENRPIETLWDVTTAATAYARGVVWQDQRLEIERAAGEVLKLAA